MLQPKVSSNTGHVRHLELKIWSWQVEAAQAAKQKAEEQLAALKQSHKAEMEAEKSHYEVLLQKARSAQVGILLLWGLCQGICKTPCSWPKCARCERKSLRDYLCHSAYHTQTSAQP